MKTILKRTCYIFIITLLGIVMPVGETVSQVLASAIPITDISSSSDANDAISKVKDASMAAISSSDVTADSSTDTSSTTVDKNSSTTSQTELTRAATTEAADSSTLLTGVNGTVTWSVDSEGTLHFSGGSFSSKFNQTLPWKSVSTQITKVSIDGEITVAGMSNYQYLFANLPNLTEIDGLSNLKMADVTSTYYMFYNDAKLLKVDFEQTDFSKVITMASMFHNCTALTEIVTKGWQTGNVTSLDSTFLNCTTLTSLDVTDWDTSKVTTMYNMFQGCTSLVTLDVSSWNTSSVANLSGAFWECSSMTSIAVRNWDTSNVTDLSNMFYSCTNLQSMILDNWNVDKVKNLGFMFSGCTNLTKVLTVGWNTSNVTTVTGMFQKCSALTELSISTWDTSNVTAMDYMFYNCRKLVTLTLSGVDWDTSKVTTFANTFFGCTGITSLDISSWDTSAATSYTNLFAPMTKLQTLKLGSKFTFHGGTLMGLPAASSNTPYTGKWQSVETKLSYTVADLMTTYDGSTMAGTYVWEKQSGTVNVKYVDGDGASIADDTTGTGEIGDDYTTTPKAIAGYTLSKTPTNATGKYTAAAQTVTYVYAGQLFFTSVSSKLDFGSHALSGLTQTYGATLDQSLSVQDNRQLNSSWHLSAQLGSAGFVGTKTGKKLSATLYYQNGNTTSAIDSATGTLITSHTTVDHQPVSVSGSWDGQATGLFLEVPAGVADLDTYTGTVTWNLGDTVKNN